MNTAIFFKSLPAVVVAGTVSAIAGLTFLPASAVTFSRTGAGFPIPDSNSTGDSSLTSSNFFISNITGILSNLAHNFISQLRDHLTYVPTNTTVTLYNRLGRVVPPITRTSDNSNFNGNSSFNHGSTTNIWTVAASRRNLFDIPAANYYPAEGNSGHLVAMLNTLGKQQPSDNWTLNVIDIGLAVDDNFAEMWNLLTKFEL